MNKTAIDSGAAAIIADGTVIIDSGATAVIESVERHYGSGSVPRQERPWIGFVHEPPGLPVWHPGGGKPERLVADVGFRADLALCTGLVAPSEHLRRWWATRVDVTVTTNLRECPFVASPFSIAALLANPTPRIVQFNAARQKLHAIRDLPVSTLLRTTVDRMSDCGLPGRIDTETLFAAERSAFGPVTARNSDVVDHIVGSEEIVADLLASNVVFAELYAAAADETVLACLAHGTPILVQPLPAVREYLGDDYPLFYATRSEAARKAEDVGALEAAHEHLVARATVLRALRRPDLIRGAG